MKIKLNQFRQTIYQRSLFSMRDHRAVALNLEKLLTKSELGTLLAAD